MQKIILAVLTIFFISSACNKTQPLSPLPAADNNTTTSTSPPTPDNSAPVAQLREPINNALSRITKKPFGIYITPKNSPVQPEKFAGYHTGVDFETTADEQNIDVPIFAACDGKLLLKKYASGYGGVAVESCELDGNDMTIIYGHVRLSSVAVNVGDKLKAGDKFAVLGKGYSSETDGERKHLHFGIHKGTSVNILGYVQKQSELSAWLDAAKYLK